jgi:hypothetical protein
MLPFANSLASKDKIITSPESPEEQILWKQIQEGADQITQTSLDRELPWAFYEPSSPIIPDEVYPWRYRVPVDVDLEFPVVVNDQLDKNQWYLSNHISKYRCDLKLNTKDWRCLYGREVDKDQRTG